MKRFILMVAAVAVYFVGESQALEVTDGKLLPTWYGREAITTDKDGKEIKAIVFNTQPVAISHEALGNVLKAYGLTVVDVTKAPNVVQAVKSKGEDDKDTVKYVYLRPDVHGFAPETTNAMLSAHGVRVIDAKKLPAAYGRAITQKDKDGKEVQVILFSKAPYAKSPSEWNQILSAYGK